MPLLEGIIHACHDVHERNLMVTETEWCDDYEIKTIDCSFDMNQQKTMNIIFYDDVLLHDWSLSDIHYTFDMNYM